MSSGLQNPLMSLTLRPGTLKRYRGDMARHVKPYLGRRNLPSLRQPICGGCTVLFRSAGA